MSLLDVGTAITIRAGIRTSVWPDSPKPAQDAFQAAPLELGLKFSSDVDGVVCAVRFYKCARNVGPHQVTVWDADGFVLAQAMSAAEPDVGWVQVNLPTPVSIKAGAIYTASYHTAGGFSTTARAFDAGPIINGPLHALAGVYSAGTFPSQTWAGQNYGVDVVFYSDMQLEQALPAVANAGTLQSIGATGTVRYGFNIHQWPYAGGIADAMASVHSMAYRVNYNYAAYVSGGLRGGNNGIVLDGIIAAANDGLHCLLGVGTPSYPISGSALWADCWRDIAAWLKANNLSDKVVLGCGNEPNYNTVTAQQYFDAMKVAHDAMKAANPAARMSAPVINASYGAVNWINALKAIPGFYDLFEFGDSHPYYQTPENSWRSDVDAFVTRVGGDQEFVASECGWSTAVGAISNQTTENRGSTGSTIVQPEQVAADYYSRFIPITRASKKMRYVTFYGLKDENPGDPNLTNVNAHFGGAYAEFSGPPKAAFPIIAELFALCQSATNAWMFTRGGTRGNESETADYFVKLQVGANNVLIAWTVGTPRNVDIAIQAPLPCKATWNVAGGVKTERALDVGTSTLSVPLGRRSVVIAADGMVDFPEF